MADPEIQRSAQKLAKVVVSRAGLYKIVTKFWAEPSSEG
jgi:hypothetical protein